MTDVDPTITTEDIVVRAEADGGVVIERRHLGLFERVHFDREHAIKVGRFMVAAALGKIAPAAKPEEGEPS